VGKRHHPPALFIGSERGFEHISVPGSPKSGLCSLGWSSGVVSEESGFLPPRIPDANFGLRTIHSCSRIAKSAQKAASFPASRAVCHASARWETPRHEVAGSLRRPPQPEWIGGPTDVAVALSGIVPILGKAAKRVSAAPGVRLRALPLPGRPSRIRGCRRPDSPIATRLVEGRESQKRHIVWRVRLPLGSNSGRCAQVLLASPPSPRKTGNQAARGRRG
jgi:hypothetical protein